MASASIDCKWSRLVSDSHYGPIRVESCAGNEGVLSRSKRTKQLTLAGGRIPSPHRRRDRPCSASYAEPRPLRLILLVPTVCACQARSILLHVDKRGVCRAQTIADGRRQVIQCRTRRCGVAGAGVRLTPDGSTPETCIITAVDCTSTGRARGRFSAFICIPLTGA